MELSALTDVDSSTVAFVQDELATIFHFSMRTGKVERTLPFGAPGDMEGLTRVGVEYFALRSDGLIYRLREESGRLITLDTIRLNVPNRNIEGLGYDERYQRILISPKDIAKGPDHDERLLYAMDARAPNGRTEVVLRLDLNDLVAQAKARGVALPLRITPKGVTVPGLKLRYSSVALHPFTDHYYLLSAVDRTLLVVDRKGVLVDLKQLDATLLPKPEGITFLPSGDLVLSSEGKGSPPVIVRYTYQGR
ncbi:MAG: SdiA-regulated domain-containing protein [Flavobacteriales bacterium]|nr:SdiA-regulated domain-containing protein [Flavobacteriales bacterium]